MTNVDGAVPAPASPAEAAALAPAVLTVFADGPYVLKGDIEIRDGEGHLVKTVTKVALCRCGSSQSKPFCDGSHKRVGFSDPGPSQSAVSA